MVSHGNTRARKQSNVKDRVIRGAKLFKNIDKKLLECTSVNLNRSSLLSAQSQLSAQRKCHLVTEAIPQFRSVTKDFISMTGPIRTRNQQAAQRLRDDVTTEILADENDVLLHILLGTSKSWEDCVA